MSTKKKYLLKVIILGDAGYVNNIFNFINYNIVSEKHPS